MTTRLKLLSALLATHNIIPDKAGTVVDYEDDARANELIGMGYAEATSEELTPVEQTAGGAHAATNAARLVTARNQEAAAAEGKAAAARAEADKANEALEATSSKNATVADPKAGAPENKDASTKATTSTKTSTRK